MRHRPTEAPAILGSLAGPLVRRVAELIAAIERGTRECTRANLDLLAAYERLDRLGRPLNAVAHVLPIRADGPFHDHDRLPAGPRGESVTIMPSAAAPRRPTPRPAHSSLDRDRFPADQRGESVAITGLGGLGLGQRGESVAITGLGGQGRGASVAITSARSRGVSAGEKVSEGQVLGTVSSLDGAQVHETITAPADGVIMFLTTSPAVADDGLLLGLGAA